MLRIIIIILLFLNISCEKQLPIEDQYTNITLIDNKIPDFSYVGYMKLEKPIPNVKNEIVLQPLEGDNHFQIQSAINRISKMPLRDGIRGAILLKTGVYNIWSTLHINTSGIILRGEGQSDDGTEIISQVTYPHQQSIRELRAQAVINIRGIGSGLIEKSDRQKLLNNIDIISSKELTIYDASMFSKGDTVSITRTPNQKWIEFVGMTDFGWTPKYFEIPHSRTIEKIENNKITINIPLTDKYLQEFGSGYISKITYEGRIKNCGVENLKISSIYQDDEDENHIWNAIILDNAEHCWVKNVTGKNLSFSAVTVLNSNFNTIQDCIITDFKSKPLGDRRYPFYIDTGSMGNLIQRCYSNGARHDFATGSKVPGPNVFFDCVGLNSLSDTGPHHRWATGTLYDNIFSSQINAINAQHRGSGHGWTGAYTMFWNNKAANSFRIESPPGAINWIVGGIGSLYSNSDSYKVSQGVRVKPRSLFLEQVRNRLGANVVKSITTPIQRTDNPIWEELVSWAEAETR